MKTPRLASGIAVLAWLATTGVVPACSSGAESNARAPATSSTSAAAGTSPYAPEASTDDRVELWWQRHRDAVEAVDIAVHDLRATAAFRSDPAVVRAGCDAVISATQAVRSGALPVPEARLQVAVDAWLAQLDAATGRCPGPDREGSIDRAAAERLVSELQAADDAASTGIRPILDEYLRESG